MKSNKIQNRRDFFECSIKSGIKYLGGITGIFISGRKSISAIEDECPDNLSCRECYRMGICGKEEAEKARQEVKKDSSTAKISKGAYHV